MKVHEDFAKFSVHSTVVYCTANDMYVCNTDIHAHWANGRTV